MPAVPELGGGEGEIGRAEVLGGVEAQQVGDAARDVGVAREVRQDLQGESERGGKRQFGGGIGQVEDAADGGTDAVGDDEFLEEAHHQQGPGAGEVFGFPDARGLDLRQELLGAVDRSGGDLGEEGNEEGKARQVTRGLEHAARDVQDVGKFFQGEEGQADRQDDAREQRVRLDADGCQSPGKAGDEETEILEECQHAHVEQEAERDQAVLPVAFFQCKRDAVIREGGKPQQDGVPGVDPAVEEVTGGEQEQVLPGGAAQEPVEGEDDQEKEQEFVAGEVHGQVTRRGIISEEGGGIVNGEWGMVHGKRG